MSIQLRPSLAQEPWYQALAPEQHDELHTRAANLLARMQTGEWDALTWADMYVVSRVYENVRWHVTWSHKVDVWEGEIEEGMQSVLLSVEADGEDMPACNPFEWTPPWKSNAHDCFRIRLDNHAFLASNVQQFNSNYFPKHDLRERKKIPDQELLNALSSQGLPKILKDETYVSGSHYLSELCASCSLFTLDHYDMETELSLVEASLGI